MPKTLRFNSFLNFFLETTDPHIQFPTSNLHLEVVLVIVALLEENIGGI